VRSDSDVEPENKDGYFRSTVTSQIRAKITTPVTVPGAGASATSSESFGVRVPVTLLTRQPLKGAGGINLESWAVV
jgi:hypothetical protein